MKDVESISQGAPSQESTISITDSNANANANSQSPISDIKEQEEKQNQSPTSASQQATRVILPSSVPVNNETPDTLVGPEDTNKDISVAPHTNGHGILSNNTLVKYQVSTGEHQNQTQTLSLLIIKNMVTQQFRNVPSQPFAHSQPQLMVNLVQIPILKITRGTRLLFRKIYTEQGIRMKRTLFMNQIGMLNLSDQP